MVSNKNKLSKKFLILTNEKDVDLSLDIRKREIRYPYVASEGKKFSAVAPVCINTTRGHISNFSFKPVTKVKKEDVLNILQNSRKSFNNETLIQTFISLTRRYFTK